MAAKLEAQGLPGAQEKLQGPGDLQEGGSPASDLQNLIALTDSRGFRSASSCDRDDGRSS